MANYMIGSKGDEVKKIQGRLDELGFYKGPIDGEFGGGTDVAVKEFQKTKGIDVDGQVGPITWRALFGSNIKEPSIIAKPLDYKCLALTGSFETGLGIPECFAGLSGDFDGQGMSLGVLQWNFGQGSLQPLLRDMNESFPDIMQTVFQENHSVLIDALNSGKEELMVFVRSMQRPSHVVNEPWRGMFKALCRTAEFQNIQLKNSDGLYASALNLCQEYGLWSARAAAMMFDIKTQNGSIREKTKLQIMSDYKKIAKDLSKEETEVQKMRIVANRRADAAKSVWAEDVRARKLCCANGGGLVHGINYDLDGQFGIGMANVIQGT